MNAICGQVAQVPDGVWRGEQMHAGMPVQGFALIMFLRGDPVGLADAGDIPHGEAWNGGVVQGDELRTPRRPFDRLDESVELWLRVGFGCGEKGHGVLTVMLRNPS